MRDRHTQLEKAVWQPSQPWRWTILAAVFLLTLTPMGAGVWIIWGTGEYSAFPLLLIAFGPATVLSLFVALTPVLEGRWLRKRRVDQPVRKGNGKG